MGATSNKCYCYMPLCLVFVVQITFMGTDAESQLISSEVRWVLFYVMFCSGLGEWMEPGAWARDCMSSSVYWCTKGQHP